MYIIYNLLMIGAFFLVMPYFIYRSICEKGFTKRLRQSLGGIHDEEIEAVAQKGCIWIHGASVGEIVATSQLKPLPKRAASGFTARPSARL